MSDQTQFSPTAGPADPKAPARSKGYAVAAGLVGLIPVLVAFNVITQDQATSLVETYGSVVGLLAAFGLGFASLKTKKQVDNGTFAPAPNLPVLTAFEQLAALKTEVDNTVNQVQAQVGDAVSTIQGAAAMIPGGAAVSSAVFSGPVGDLIQSMLDNPERR